MKPVNCRKRGILYQTSCDECKVEETDQAVYVGESARSAAERMEEHLDDAICGRKDSHIHKHWVKKHNGRQTRFSFQVLKFFKSALERQVGEAVRIMKTGAKRILNSRGEFNRCSLPIITTKEESEEETQGDSEQLEGVGVGVDEPEGEADEGAEVILSKKDR